MRPTVVMPGRRVTSGHRRRPYREEMTDRTPRHNSPDPRGVGRRAVLLGAAGLGLAGCTTPTGSSSGTTTPSTSSATTSAGSSSTMATPPTAITTTPGTTTAATSATPAAAPLPASAVWPVPPNDVEPVAKERAARIVESLTAWGAGQSGPGQRRRGCRPRAYRPTAQEHWWPQRRHSTRLARTRPPGSSRPSSAVSPATRRPSSSPTSNGRATGRESRYAAGRPPTCGSPDRAAPGR